MINTSTDSDPPETVSDPVLSNVWYLYAPMVCVESPPDAVPDTVLDPHPNAPIPAPVAPTKGQAISIWIKDRSSSVGLNGRMFANDSALIGPVIRLQTRKIFLR
jgi:hypothetical protein